MIISKKEGINSIHQYDEIKDILKLLSICTSLENVEET